MTRGPVVRQLVSYTIPLVLGNLFQLAYNIIDSMIAGRFIGPEALAATGMAAPVMNILVLGISGLCIGAGVLMSGFYGSKDDGLLKNELSTLLLSGSLLALVLSVLGLVFTRPLMRALNVPGEIMDLSVTYMRVVFIGVPFTYAYNALSQALKSVGDSKTPLAFLMASSVMNCVLDLILIGGLGFGVTCSAVTTTLSQILSAVLCFVHIRRKVPILSLGPRELRIDRGLLRKTLSFGTVTALQQTVQPVAKLLIQGAVNSLGVATIAAYNVVTRIDDFAFTPEQNISHAMTTFIAQNRGAGRNGRSYEGFYKGLLVECAYFALICLAVLFLKDWIMSLFIDPSQGADVMSEGIVYMTTMAPLYILPAMTNGIQGFFRGVGRMKVTLVSTIIQASLRVVFSLILIPRFGMHGICYACALGWVCMLAFEVPVFFMFRSRDKANKNPS